MSDVYLYVYDLSLGLVKKISKKLLGKQMEGIWHTSIFAFDREFWFAMNGYNEHPPTPIEPNEKIYLGKTDLTLEEFHEIIKKQIKDGSYEFGEYNLLTHNCNSFSNQLSITLFDKPNPAYIMDMPKTAVQDLKEAPVFGHIFERIYEKTINIDFDENDLSDCMQHARLEDECDEQENHPQHKEHSFKHLENKIASLFLKSNEDE